MFKKSKNLTDQARVTRMVLGLGLLVLGLYGLSDLFRSVAIVLATYFLVTGIVAYCPATEIFSGSSSRRSTAARSHRRHRRR